MTAELVTSMTVSIVTSVGLAWSITRAKSHDADKKIAKLEGHVAGLKDTVDRLMRILIEKGGMA